MSTKLIAGGCVGVLVALGFVFPQIAEMRMNGSLGPDGVALLFLGVAGTLGGLWCVVRGVRQGSSAAS